MRSATTSHLAQTAFGLLDNSQQHTFCTRLSTSAALACLSTTVTHTHVHTSLDLFCTTRRYDRCHTHARTRLSTSAATTRRFDRCPIQLRTSCYCDPRAYYYPLACSFSCDRQQLHTLHKQRLVCLTTASNTRSAHAAPSPHARQSHTC